MGKLNVRTNETFNRIVGSIVLCGALFLSVLILGKVDNLETDVKGYGIYLGFATLLLGFAEVMSFFRFKAKEGKLAYIRIIYIVLDLAATICAFMHSMSGVFFLLSGSLYLAIPLFKRLASIMRKKTKRNITINVLVGIINLLIFLISLICFAMDEGGEAASAMIVGFTMLIICLINVASMSLSNFNVDLLKKIVKKTYAGEIVFGLLVLIVSFAMALMITEDSINNMEDALWYCFSIVTTIGLGDFAATSTLGRVLSVILGIYGIIVVAIVTSIIVNFYNEVKTIPEEDDEEEIAENIIAEEAKKLNEEDAIKDKETNVENPTE